MVGSTIGKTFRVTTFGESHGIAVGATVDGCPSGLELTREDVQREMDRRRPGTSDLVSKRKEKDKVDILSGLFEEKTTGTPIQMIVYNLDADSSAYESLINHPRPGHADLTYALKYGRRDHRGGGRASGRETVGRVMGGAVAKKLLAQTHGIRVAGHTLRIGGIEAGSSPDFESIMGADDNPVRCTDAGRAEEMIQAIKNASEEGDSLGGVAQVVARGVPAGVGEPIYDKLDAEIAKALVSIGSVKGVEFGAGFELAGMKGSESNDQITVVNGSPRLVTNRSGGVLGGISTGDDIVANFVVKPTSSISKVQQTLDMLTMEKAEIRTSGRHDPCIVPRIIPVAESMVAIVLADLMLQGGFIPPSRI
jgi:chorismate synthase